MKSEIELELKKIGVIEINKNLFNNHWDFLYHILLTEYGISSNDADEELENYFKQLN